MRLIDTQNPLKINNLMLVWAPVEEFYVAVSHFHSIFAHCRPNLIVWVEVGFGFSTVQSIFIDYNFAEIRLHRCKKLKNSNEKHNTM